MSAPARQSRECPPAAGPFSLADGAAYARWRGQKLRHHPRALDEQRVPIARLGRLREAERAALLAACRRANFAIYRTDPDDPPTLEDVRAFAAQLGLVTLDRHLWAPDSGVATLSHEHQGGRAGYIPYTDRAMGWHTDGYYNTTETAVRGVIMHCVAPAAEGGASWLLDPEMVYIALRDADPGYVEALMRPDVMTVPENDLEPGAPRPAVTGPVFSVAHTDGALHMRYTARTRSIRWRDDAPTRAAIARLDALLEPRVSFAFRVHLRAGEGILCNNVLHGREAFKDDPAGNRRRVLWRARFRERVAGCGPSEG